MCDVCSSSVINNKSSFTTNYKTIEKKQSSFYELFLQNCKLMNIDNILIYAGQILHYRSQYRNKYLFDHKPTSLLKANNFFMRLIFFRCFLYKFFF